MALPLATFCYGLAGVPDLAGALGGTFSVIGIVFSPFFCGVLPSKPESELDLKLLALSGGTAYHLPQVSTSIWVAAFCSYRSPYGFWMFLPSAVP